jgi:hypothetical protein
MSAWVLALGSLLITAASCVGASLPNAELAVYLTVNPSQPSAPLESMKREVSSLMQAAGYRVVWRDPRAPGATGETSELVVLDLRGSCALPAGSYRIDRSVDSGASLAETFIGNNGVSPFSWVNCANVTRMIGPALSGEAPAQRDYLYGRAVGRVIAHELYHVMMGSTGHGHDGVAKARFSVANLLNERFEFDSTELAVLRQKAVDAEARAGLEPAFGR